MDTKHFTLHVLLIQPKPCSTLNCTYIDSIFREKYYRDFHKHNIRAAVGKFGHLSQTIRPFLTFCDIVGVTAPRGPQQTDRTEIALRGAAGVSGIHESPQRLHNYAAM